jgi:hypothetical protein
MNVRALIAFTVLACTAILALHETAPAYERGLTEQNRQFVTGGVGREEQLELEAQQRRFSLWLITADERSGAWLSDAAVEIRDAHGAPVLATTMTGPYLLVDLDPGRYRLLVTLRGETRALSTDVSRDIVRRVVVRFNTGADVLPDPRDRMSDRTVLAVAAPLSARHALAVGWAELPRARGLLPQVFAQRRGRTLVTPGVWGAPA